VLIDHTGADVSDLWTFSETVDDKRVKVVIVGDRDVNEEVFVAGDDKDPQCLGELGHPVAEGFDDQP